MAATTNVTTGRLGWAPTKGRVVTAGWPVPTPDPAGAGRAPTAPGGGLTGHMRHSLQGACGAAGSSVPGVFKRTPSIADLKPVRRFVAKHSYQGGVVLPVTTTLPGQIFPHGETAVRRTGRDAARRARIGAGAVPGGWCATIAPAEAIGADGGSAGVVTGTVSVQSSDCEEGRLPSRWRASPPVVPGWRFLVRRERCCDGPFPAGEIAEKKMCHADI